MALFKDWISEKEFALHRIETLVALLISSSLGLMSIVFPFLHTYMKSPLLDFIIFVVIEGAIVWYWYYNRSVFPKYNSNKMTLVIAIVTENAKQKTRITNDFAKHIKKRIIDLNLENSYDVIVLHNHLSKITQNRINLYMQSLKAGLTDSEDIKKFEQLKNRLNAKFFIHGDLIKRNPENSTYCLSLDAMILHSQTDAIRSESLSNEFQALWKREIVFLEKEELTGFKANAEHIFFTASYMLGLATFVDNNFEQGVKIWEGIELYSKDKPELSNYLGKILELKSISYFLLSRYLYFSGRIDDSIYYRNRYLELSKNTYDSYLTEAMNQVKLRNDPEMALEFINKAKEVAQKDGTWRYSELYLLIRLSRCKEALNILDDIINYTYDNEIDTINQVIIYNNICLKEDPAHIQTHFIIGALLYKKLDLPLPSHEKFENFVNSSLIPDNWEPLKERATEYLTEINRIIGVVE